MMMKWIKAYAAAQNTAARRSDGWLREAAACTEAQLLAKLSAAPAGLTEEQAGEAREKYGSNRLAKPRRKSAPRRLLEAFADPFSLVLLLLAVVSAFTDILFVAPGERNYMTVGIITVMVAVSGVLRFVQETRSGNVAEKLTAMIHTTACLERAGVRQELPMEEIVVGDIVHLSAGDMIPADLRILQAKDLFISQSALTGESEPVEKTGAPVGQEGAALPVTEVGCLAFQGSTVISGSARAVSVAVGDGTMFGSIARTMGDKPPKTAFDKGIGSVTRLLIRFMAVMAPVVLFLNGFTKGSWMEALLFAISVAVGLTPEMLPMIVTTSLAKGALEMSRQKVIIKNLNAIQNLGSVDILCTDKTGTLTQDKVVLEMHLDIDGNPDDRVLRHAFLNSWFQTGLKNLIDLAVIAKQEELGAAQVVDAYSKVDEVPFDFERRRMSVVVCDTAGKTQMVTKGAVEEMLDCCAWAEREGRAVPLTEEVRRQVLVQADRLNAQGMRVIAVAQKSNPAPGGAVLGCGRVRHGADRLPGFPRPAQADGARRHRGPAQLRRPGQGADWRQRKGDQGHLRPGGPARGAHPAGQRHRRHDRPGAGRPGRGRSRSLPSCPRPRRRASSGCCARTATGVGLHGGRHQRRRRPAGRDVSFSVDTAVDVAKESASIVLLDKDLMVLEQGLIEGRKTVRQHDEVHQDDRILQLWQHAAVLAASAFLPFLPMTPCS